MKQPLISIVMVNYNHEDTIGKTMESVLAQTYQNWELIIVDDGSTDESVAIIESYAKKDERIRYYPQKENAQICVVTNIGLSYVKGEYVARLDSDDIWLPQRLEKQMQYLSEHPEVALCFTRLDIIDEKDEIINDKLPDYYEAYNQRQKSRAQWARYFFFFGNTLIQSALLMRREVVDAIGGFNLAYMQAHDFDFFTRAVLKYEFGFVEEPLVLYRRAGEQNSASNEVNDRRFLNEFMSIRFYFLENMPNELFVEAFQKDFVNEDSKSEIELQCERAFLLCRCMEDGKNPVLGVWKFEELMRNPETVKVLKEKFSFTPKDFYRLSVKHLYVTQKMKGEWEYAVRLIPMLEAQIEEMKKGDEELRTKYMEQYLLAKSLAKELEDMRDTLSWKITKPLRNIKKTLDKG